MKSQENHAKILVIDDEEGIRDMLSFSLKYEGYDVQVAENGERGIDIAARDDIDVVITDMKMPGLSGLEVLARIKKIKPNLEIIVATGFATLETAQKSLVNGAYAYINKPFDLFELLNLISDAYTKKKQIS